jgi:hypothetical protein
MFELLRSVYPRLKLFIFGLWFVLGGLEFIYCHYAITYGIDIITGLLILDLLLNLFYSKDRLAFCKENWFELLSLLPIFRILKFGKMLKIVKLLKKMYSGFRKIKRIQKILLKIKPKETIK